MPIMDGLEFVRRVREYENLHKMLNYDSLDLNDEFKNIRINCPNDKKKTVHRSRVKRSHIVIGMSANSDDETRKEALSIGMDSFIAKPFNVARFCNVLNTVCATRKEEGLPSSSSPSHLN